MSADEPEDDAGYVPVAGPRWSALLRPAAPSIEVPKAYLGVPHPDPAQRSSLAKMLMSFCQFAPLTAEQLGPGGDFSFCTSYREGAVMPPSTSTSGA